MNSIPDNLAGIEKQHVQLTQLALRVCAGLRYDQDKEGLEDALLQLERLMRIHFQDEESLMRRYGYEGLDSHQRTHKGIMERFEKLKRDALHRFDAGAKGKLLIFLENDCCYHIVEDQAAWKTGEIEKIFAYQRLREREQALE